MSLPICCSFFRHVLPLLVIKVKFPVSHWLVVFHQVFFLTLQCAIDLSAAFWGWWIKKRTLCFCIYLLLLWRFSLWRCRQEMVGEKREKAFSKVLKVWISTLDLSIENYSPCLWELSRLFSHQPPVCLCFFYLKYWHTQGCTILGKHSIFSNFIECLNWECSTYCKYVVMTWFVCKVNIVRLYARFVDYYIPIDIIVDHVLILLVWLPDTDDSSHGVRSQRNMETLKRGETKMSPSQYSTITVLSHDFLILFC